MTLSAQDIRQFARDGASRLAVAIVTEFPDLLPELNALAAPATNGPTNGRTTRRLSAAGRRNIAAAQRKRLARQRRATGQ